MKILHCLPGAFGTGGIEKVVKEIITLVGTEYDFAMLCQSNIVEEASVFFKAHNIKYYVLPPKSKKFSEYKKQFAEVIRQFDIIHIHAVYSFSYFEAKWAKLLGKKVIFHSHNSSATFKRRLVHRILKSRIVKYTDVNLAVSSQAGKWMFSGNFEVLFNGINIGKYLFDDSKRSKIREEYGFTQNTKIICCVGRLDLQKDPIYSLNITIPIIKKNPNVVLFFIGEGNLKKKLVQKTTEENVSNEVFFLGNVQNVSDYLSAGDIFLLPSKFEGLSLAIVEAQISNLSCLVSDNVAKEGIINQNVFLISKKNPNKWTKCLEEEIKVSDESRTTLISPEFNKFSDGEMKKKLEKMYNKFECTLN